MNLLNKIIEWGMLFVVLGITASVAFGVLFLPFYLIGVALGVPVFTYVGIGTGLMAAVYIVAAGIELINSDVF